MAGLTFSSELEEFRRRVRAHIAAHHPGIPRLAGTRSPEAETMPRYRAWCASLFAAGLLGGDWPLEWGGTGAYDPLREHIVDTELAAANLPRPVGAWNLVCGALLRSGSDLASLRTAARRDGGQWVVSGQKVWTTHGHVADLGFLLARTDPRAAKHEGISAFIVDMRTPGISVRPLREMTGSSDFNEVLFDDARLPADAIIGRPGEGWAIARASLAHERGQSLREDSATERVRSLVRLTAAAGPDREEPGPGGPDREEPGPEEPDRGGPAPREGYSAGPDRGLGDAGARRTLGRLYARSSVADLLGLEGVLKEAAGQPAAYDAPAVKVLFSETNLDISTYALDILGARGVLTAPSPDAVAGGMFQDAFLWARGFTISAGSNEILRNLIAERGLRLPKG